MGRKPKRNGAVAPPHPFAFLTEWRERAGLTQAEVAAKFSVTDVTIHRWETGKAPVTVRSFVLLSKLYGAETPGHLLFPVAEAARASTLREADSLMANMSAEDLYKWMEIGRSLARRVDSPASTEENLREP